MGGSSTAVAEKEERVDPLEVVRKEVFSFDPATEWTPYQRLAAAVILHAVTDRRDTSPGSPARGRIDTFLFGQTDAAKVVRDHWFRQAGLPAPTTEMVLALIRRLSDENFSEYRVIVKSAR